MISIHVRRIVQINELQKRACSYFGHGCPIEARTGLETFQFLVCMCAPYIYIYQNDKFDSGTNVRSALFRSAVNLSD